MIVIGLTGSVGMGKTTVAHMFREAGVPVHDSDAAVHALLGPDGEAVKAVSALFPGVLTTDEVGHPCIDRAALGRVVFADRGKKQQLEDILHPMVRARADAFIADMKRRGHDSCVLDVPLLFETGRDKDVDVTVVVSAPLEAQRARVMARHGMTAERFDAIVAGQMPDPEKRKRAKFIIENGGDLSDTRAQVLSVLNKLGAKTIAR